MKPIYDGIGQELCVGDDVAYISRAGTHLSMKRRIITAMGWQPAPYAMAHGAAPEAYLKLDGANRIVMPYNVVRVAAK